MFILSVLLSFCWLNTLQALYGTPYGRYEMSLGRGDGPDNYKMFDPRLLPHYAAIVGDRTQNKWVILDAFYHLARMPYVNDELLDAAPRWATHPEHRLRKMLGVFLTAHAQPRHAPVIASLLYDHDSSVCDAAVGAMAKIETPESLLALEIWLARPPYSLADQLEKTVAGHVATLRVKLAARGRVMASWPPFPEPKFIEPSPVDLVPVGDPRRKR